MGTWGVGIFDDDVALDIRDAFEDALANGLSVAVATQKILEDFAEYLEDSDDRPVIFLALTALQLEQGTLQPDMREMALRIIASGEAMACWQDTDATTQAERVQVLETLQSNLVAS
jgi:hypothetical protein